MQPASRYLSILLTIVVGAQATIGLLVGAAPHARAATSTSLAQPTNHLVISEIQTRPNEGFIELYNPTAQAVNLNGWSIQYHTSPLAYPLPLANTIAFDATDIVPAYGHFLVRGEAAGAADAYFSTFSIDRTTGTVLLVAGSQPVAAPTDATVVDRVAYGRLSEGGEGNPAPVPAAGRSIERAPGMGEGNGVDTNDNESDFIATQVATPQTSGNPGEVPHAPVFTNLNPAHNGFISTVSPMITVNVTDIGSGVDPDGFAMHLDGLTVEPTYNESTDQLMYQTPNLSQGAHTVHIIATDRAGLQAELMSTFTVDMTAPSLSLIVPPTVSSYAATAQLQAVDSQSGVLEMRIAFDGTIDSEVWEPFNANVTRGLRDGIANQSIVAQVRDGAGNPSAIVMAPVTVVPAPLAAPVSPISSTVGDTITITWPTVAGATHYLVKYTDGSTIYGPIYTTTPAIVISKLSTAKKYHFEVAAVDASGAVSMFAKVFPPAPAKGTLATATTETVADQPAAPAADDQSNMGSTQDNQTVTPSPTPSASPTLSPSPTASPEVKGGDDSRSPDWTRIIVALSILIIAAGVATGGWYLYQWLASRPNDDNKGGRW